MGSYIDRCNDSTHVRQMRQRAEIQRDRHSGGHARYRCTSCGLSPVCARRRAGGPLPLSREALSRTQLATQHRARDQRFAHDRGQAGKKSAAAKPTLTAPTAKKARIKRWEALELNEMWTFVGHCALP